jgi:hypothetical protein
MMNNYNSLGYRTSSVLNSQETEVVANAPNLSGKWRNSWMMSFFTIISFILANNIANAQNPANYAFSVSSGTYNEITVAGGATACPTAYADDVNQNITGLTAFNVNGVNYTNFQMNSNGRLSLYTTTAPTTTGTYTPLSSSITNAAVVIAPFGGDLNTSSAATSGWFYQTIGTELVFQWTNVSRYNISGSNDILNFQIRLDTATGNIVFVYGTCTQGSNPTSAPQVGFRTSTTFSTGVNNLNLNITGSPTSCNWSDVVTGYSNASTVYINNSATNPSIKPTSGLTYTWVKQANPAPVRTFAAPSAITNSGATLSWTAPTSATSYNVQYRIPGTCSWTNWSGNPVATNSVTLTGLSQITTYQVRVQASNGTTQSIYSHIPSSTGTGDGYSTSGTFTTLAACSSVPSALTSSAIAPNTATISWTAPASPPANGYEYYYSTSSTAPTVSTTPSGSTAAGVVSASLTGLSQGTQHYFWVRTNCNGTDKGVWTGSSTFTTTCNAYAIPYSEDFETAVVPALPMCVTSSHPLTRSTTATGAGPRSGTKYQNIRWTPTVTKYLYSAPLALTASTSYDMGAWYMTDGITGWTTIKLYANTSASVTGATLLTTVSGATNTTYSKLVGSYVPSSTGTYYFIIEVVHNGTPNDMSIDDMFAMVTPTCFEPTALTASNLTATTADVSWTAPTTGTTPAQYEYAVTTSATPPASGTVSTSTSVTGVTIVPNVNYYLHVRSECVLATDYSAWATSAPFKFISGDVCSTAIDLTTLTSPYSGDTTGAADNFTNTCAGGNTSPDLVYYIDVPSNYTLVIGQTSNGYDSENTVFYGATCPGTTQIACYDDPDVQNVTWTNSTGSTQRVYWVQDGFSNSTNFGTFVLAWSLTPPPIVVTSFSPTAACSADLATTTITLTGSNFTDATDVKLNGVSHSYTVVNDTTITVSLTATSTAGTFVVYNAVTSGTNATALTINTNPTVDPIVGSSSTICAPNTLALTDNTAGGVWSSSNTAVATVDTAGLVTGVAEGSAVISYTVTDNGCSTAVTYNVDVKDPVNISTQPAPQIILTGANASFSVAATGTGVTYQWQENTGSGFSDVTDGGVYSGATTNALTITGATAGMSGYEYQCVVTGTSPCSPATSNSALLTVSNTGISSHPVNVDLCDSGTATFSVTATGDVNSYQWYEDDGLGPIAITNGGDYSGADTATLTIANVTTAKNGFTYYVDVIGPAVTVSSTTATLNVATGVSYTANPSNQTVCYSGGNATFSATATGSFTGYQWQYSTDNSNWNNVVNGTPAGASYTGATTDTLNVATTASTPATGTYYYRALATAQAPCSNMPSTSAQLLINNPAITTQPVATTVLAGNSTTLTAASDATGTVTYQWQYATTAAGTYTNVVNGTPANVTYSGADTATLTVATTSATAASTANYYRLVVSANGCAVNSNGGQLTIANYCTTGLTSSGGASDSITNVVITNTTTSANVTQASSAASPWYTLYNNTPLDVTQGQSLSVAMTFGTDGTQYSAVWVDYNKNGTFEASENVALAASSAAGSSTVTYTFSVPLTASTGVTRIRLRGASDSAYTAAGACTSTSWGETEDYFLNIIAAPACTGTPVAGTAISSVANVCFSGSANLSATGYTTGVTGISMQWYNSAGAISGANAATFTTPVLSATETYFLRVTCADSGLYADTNSITIGVNAPSVDTTTPGTRCGTGTVDLSGTASTGATLNWFSTASGGTPLGTGNTFTTPTIAATTQYYVEASIGGSSMSGARTAPASTTSTTPFTYGLVFNVTTAFVLNSVKVYPNSASAGNVTIQLQNSSGTVLQTLSSFALPAATGTTAVTVPLGWNVAVGTGYRLVATTGTSLVRESSIGGFPYSLGTAGSITSGYISGPSSTAYYFFYDWSISTGCSSARTMVEATVTPAPALSISSATNAICAGLSTTTPVTITSTVADYDTYTWSPSTGVSGDSTSGYTFNPSATTTYTLTATNASGCANTVTHTVTVNALPSVFAVTPTTSNVCSIDAATLLSVAPANATPPSGACTEEANGLYPATTFTIATCNGTTVNTVTTAGWAGEYSMVSVSANTLYTFTSSGSGDYVTIADSTGATVLAYGLSPLTYFNATAQDVRFYSQISTCATQNVSRTRSFTCRSVDGAVFSPTTGLYTDAAATTAYTGGAVISVYAKPTATTTYTATVTNASGCIRTATATINVTTATTWYLDADNDGYGVDATSMLACSQPTGYAALSGDCDDANPTTHPGAVDVCYDGIDNDCNGVIDNVGMPGGCEMPTVISAECGSTITNLYTTIHVTWFSNAQEYRFKVTNMTTNAVQYVDRPVNNLALSNVPGTTLGTQYKIECTVKINGAWLPNYGTPCFVTTQSSGTTIGAQCGTTLTSMSQWIYATSVANATGYRFKVTNTVDSSVQITDQLYNKFNFGQLPNRLYATVYSVEVSVKDSNGTYLPYGSACTITTPAFPTTQIRTSQCNYTVTSKYENIAADLVSGATKYRFRLFNTALGYDQYIDRVGLNTFNLSMFAGLLPATTYSVQVAVYIGTQWGPYDKTCTLTTPALAKAPEAELVVSNEPFKALAYPNPYTNEFQLNVTTSSSSVIEVKVYDMIGKLVEQTQVEPRNIETLQIGNNYPSGVYNVIVTQDENNQTLRVIKR